MKNVKPHKAAGHEDILLILHRDTTKPIVLVITLHSSADHIGYVVKMSVS